MPASWSLAILRRHLFLKYSSAIGDRRYKKEGAINFVIIDDYGLPFRAQFWANLADAIPALCEVRSGCMAIMTKIHRKM